METLSADQSSCALDTKHGTSVNGNSETDSSSPKVDGFDFTASQKPSVTFSTDSPQHDPFWNFDDNSKSGYDSSPENGTPIQLGSGDIEKPVSGSGTEDNGQPSNHEVPLLASTPAVQSDVSDSSLGKDLATESPPIQVMDRSGYDPNRIPTSVFDRTKSTNPMEWSVASNESLFSIQMGNMSFTKEQFVFRSGELGAPGELSTSDQMYNYSSMPQPPPPTKSADRQSRDMRTEAAVETMREVIRESEDKTKGMSTAEGQISRSSRASGTSAKSFAFPVLPGGMDQAYSVRIGGSPATSPGKKRPKSPQSEPSPKEVPKAEEATKKASNSRSFSCIYCCSFCSK